MRIVTTGALALLLGLAGCSLFDDNPYSGFSVGEVDESGPEREAVILVGDPQVISRETLINDRLREVAHIEELLSESKNQRFTPQVLRDLSVCRLSRPSLASPLIQPSELRSNDRMMLRNLNPTSRSLNSATSWPGLRNCKKKRPTRRNLPPRM